MKLESDPCRATLCLLFLLACPAPGGEVLSPGSAQLGADSEWPQWLGPRRDGIWRETGILSQFPAAGPAVRWRTPIGGGYSGPAVAGGKVFVTDRVLNEGVKNPANPFQRGAILGKERVLCLNEADGKQLWSHEYDCAYTVSYPAGPRTTPLVQDGKVYTLGAEGHLFCFNAADGKVLWSHDLQKEYEIRSPMWGYAASPLIEGNKLITLLGGGVGRTVAAFDKDSGKEIWKALNSSEIGYAPPMVFEAGGKRQLIVWHPESLNSLDPETGAVYWTEKFASKSGLALPTPRKLGNQLLITSFYNGSMLMNLDAEKPAASVAWRVHGTNERNTEGLHAIMCTPFLDEGHIYGVCSYGQFRCLELAGGKRVWESLAPTGGANERWANAFIVKNEDKYFVPNEKGELIVARLSPKGWEELSRAKLLQPTNKANNRDVVWSHPAFANRSVYMRNDKEIVCVSLAK